MLPWIIYNICSLFSVSISSKVLIGCIEVDIIEKRGGRVEDLSSACVI